MATKKDGQPRKKPVTTTRSTSGEAYDFEDEVGAWFLVKMLSGQPVSETGGFGVGLKNQTGALGWEIDDLLVETDGQPLAVSCKGNVQVTANGLPKDFVERVWAQTTQDDPPASRTAYFALATRDSHPEFNAKWSDIKSWATGPDDALTLARIAASPKHRAIFESVTGPSEGAHDETAWLPIVRRIDVLPFNFQLAPSKDVAAAVQDCRQLLRDGALATAQQLWRSLVERVHASRVGGGAIALDELWDSLRQQFDLKDHPTFQADWRVLRELTSDYLATIATSLPGDITLIRQKPRDDVARAVVDNGTNLVVGGSGVGKSAIVRAALDTHFPNHEKLWLGPDELEKVLSATGRRLLTLNHPLTATLRRSPATGVILVVDAAERILERNVTAANAFLKELSANGVRLIVVGQALWASSAGPLVAGLRVHPVSIEQLSTEEVAAALRSSPAVRWVASRPQLLTGLRNLRTLGWVMEAAVTPEIGQTGLATPSAIVDLVFGRWTGGKVALERLLTTLAVREAEFERSFAISDIDRGDAEAFDSRPDGFPIRKNKQRRLEFEHDLAADWARFELLKEKEIAGAEWHALAVNPLWHNALRLAGQWLLRETEGETSGWDQAIARLKREDAGLTLDLLLDALFTDPEAERFFEEKAELLFANQCELLRRLLVRFRHIATVTAWQGGDGADQSFALHFESEFRSPIVGYWPALANFLHRHRDRAAACASAEIARVASIWLTATPRETSDGAPFPFRLQFAEVALACGRAMQLDLLKHRFHYGKEDQPTFSAALLAADDIPDGVADFALEMARRRPTLKSVVEEANAFHREHARKAREKAKESSQRSRAPRPIPSFFAPERLPPWPLGPKERLDEAFREAVLQSGSIGALMRARPAVASEVVLASIIEDNPVRDRSSLRDGFGLKFDNDAYLVAFWKGPFFLLLGINPERALGCVIQLVNFCTERWQADLAPQNPPSIKLTLADGSNKAFIGNRMVFEWDRLSSMHSGQLGCALAALEKWLMVQLDQSQPIDAYVERLLLESKSLAILGVLLRVGKYRPEVFAGCLRPLLKSHEIYQLDDARVREGEFFDAMSWARAGDDIFEMAKQFVFAPHRKTTLRRVAAALLREDSELASEVATDAKRWPKSKDKKYVLERDALIEELDPRNYSGPSGHAETEGVTFSYPKRLLDRLQPYQSRASSNLGLIGLPLQCSRALQQRGVLTPETAAYLASVISSKRSKGVSAGDYEQARLAAAATLVARGGEWLASNAETSTEVSQVVAVAVAGLATARERRTPVLGNMAIETSGYAIIQKLTEGATDANWSELALVLLTCGDMQALAVLMSEAYARKLELGKIWPRLVFLGVLASGLSILAPRYDGDAVEPALWTKWQRWLQTRSLTDGDLTLEQIDFTKIAKLVGKLEYQQAAARADRDYERYRMRHDPKRRVIGLDWNFLRSLLAWLLQSEGPLDAAGKQLLKSLWHFESWRAYGQTSVDDESDRERPMEHLGYEVLNRIARVLPTVNVNEARDIWEPILRLGAMSHYAVDHFISSWMLLLGKDVDLEVFYAHWRAMAEYALTAPGWTDGRQWYYGENMLCQILGFGTVHLKVYPNAFGLVPRMADLYERWAAEHLAGREENVSAFCYFLSEAAGAPLRVKALPWIAKALEGDSWAAKWRRDETGKDVLAYLSELIASEGPAIAANAKQRNAAMRLAAHLVAQQVSGAMALHDRFSRLR
ncbi:hypothetical protein ACVDG5_036110 [Mesorhizobium sp. ORM6]